MKRFHQKVFLAFLFIFYSFSVMAQAEESWSEWVRQLRVEAVADGIRPQVFDEVFSNISGPNPKVLRLYNTQPEGRLTFLAYRRTRADKARIQLGIQEYHKNQALLNAIGRKFGVDPCFILSLWGLETDYGHFMGNFSVPHSLATLAYESRRKAFFRNELLKALHIIQDGHVSVENFKGEWAGASGHPQFLPSSWYKYAVDYDGDGRKDIWKSLPDALASIANYLAKNGWQAGQPWAVEVTLPAGFDSSLIGKTVVKPVSAWRNLGVQINHKSWPVGDMAASIIQPGSDGPVLMVFHNFRTLQTWNDSNYYISTVGYLADQICHTV
jgi:membrane-bound lytic murein transglycosylase B